MAEFNTASIVLQTSVKLAVMRWPPAPVVQAIKQLVGWQLSPTHPLTQWHGAVEIIGTGLFFKLLLYLPRAPMGEGARGAAFDYPPLVLNLFHLHTIS